MGKLRDYGNFKYGVMLKMADVAGKPVTIEAADFTKGQYGEIVVIRIKDAKGKLGSIVTGSVLIKSALEDAKKQNAFPIDATFVKNGRMWDVE